MKWYESQRVRLAVALTALLCAVTLGAAVFIGSVIWGERGMAYGAIFWGMLWTAIAYGLT
jgi:hypothetical protein